jgi:hypothetical protein
MNLPLEVATLTHRALIILIPWPGAIGYRRFYQGILIRNNLTRRVAYGTVVRITAMSITALIIFLLTEVQGVILGAAALSLGVTCEAVASRIMANPILKSLNEQEHISSDTLSHKDIYNFYYPLALTSIITLGVQPLVTFFMGQSRMPLESLAVLPVLTSFVFIFRSLGLSFQEVVIALSDKEGINYKSLKKFAIILSSVLVGILALISFSPLADLWFHNISGLSNELTMFTRIPLMIMAIFPMLTVLISFQRAILVDAKKTKPITLATSIEFCTIVLALIVGVKFLSLVGVIAATVAFVIGRIGAITYLSKPVIKTIKNYY